MNLSTQQYGRFRRQSGLSKNDIARLRTARMAAQSAVRTREDSFRRNLDRYVQTNPGDADLRRKAYAVVKLAPFAHGLGQDGN
jgi:hypothetical protein